MEKLVPGTTQESCIEVLLTESQLAARWQITIKKLQADRWKGVGVPYVKIGRLVRYSPVEVDAYEARHSVAVEQ